MSIATIKLSKITAKLFPQSVSYTIEAQASPVVVLSIFFLYLLQYYPLFVIVELPSLCFEVLPSFLIVVLPSVCD